MNLGSFALTWHEKTTCKRKIIKWWIGGWIKSSLVCINCNGKFLQHDRRPQNGCVELVVIIKNISRWIHEINVYNKQNSTSCRLLKKNFYAFKSSSASNFMSSASHSIEYKESQKHSVTAHFLLMDTEPAASNVSVIPYHKF